MYYADRVKQTEVSELAQARIADPWTYLRVSGQGASFCEAGNRLSQRVKLGSSDGTTTFTGNMVVTLLSARTIS